MEGLIAKFLEAMKESEVRTATRLDRSLARFKDELKRELVRAKRGSTGTSSPEATTEEVEVVHDDTADGLAPAATTADVSCPNTKAQEVLEVIHDAPPACIAMAHITCSTDGSNQVVATNSVNKVTAVYPEPVIDLSDMFGALNTPKYSTVSNRCAAVAGTDEYALVAATPDVAIELAVLPGVSSHTNKAHEVLAVPHDASPVYIGMAPVTCSTKCSNQVGATSFPFPVTTASLLPAATPSWLVLRPKPWPSFWRDHAEETEVRPIPWPSFSMGRFLEHPYMSVQLHGSGLTSSSIPKKLFHIGDFMCDTWERWYNLNGHSIRIFSGLFLCLWSLKQDNADSGFSKHVKLFHGSHWLVELCACASTMALVLHQSCLATPVVHLLWNAKKMGALSTERSSNVILQCMQFGPYELVCYKLHDSVSSLFASVAVQTVLSAYTIDSCLPWEFGRRTIMGMATKCSGGYTAQLEPRSLFRFSQKNDRLKLPRPSCSCNFRAVQVRSALPIGEPPDDDIYTNSIPSPQTPWVASILFQTAHRWAWLLPTPSRLPDELIFTPGGFASSLVGPLVESMCSRIKLRPLPWPSWECYRGWKLLVRQVPSFTEGRSHNEWSIWAYWGSLELNLILHSHRTSIFDPIRQWEYGRRTSLGIVTQISGGSEAVQGTMMLMDISMNWHFLRKEEFERSVSHSHDSMIIGGKEVLVTRLLTNMFCCNTTKSEVIQSLFLPERHINGISWHVLVTGSQWQWFSSGYAPIFIVENVPAIGNQLNCLWRLQLCLGVILVQISTGQIGVASCMGKTSDPMEKFSCYWSSWFMPLTAPLETYLIQYAITCVGMKRVKNTFRMVKSVELCSTAGHLDVALRVAINLREFVTSVMHMQIPVTVMSKFPGISLSSVQFCSKGKDTDLCKKVDRQMLSSNNTL